MIQYLHWYHEDIYGEKKLLKTSKNSNDPYLHTIRSLEDTDLGRDGFVQHIFLQCSNDGEFFAHRPMPIHRSNINRSIGRWPMDLPIADGSV